MSGDPLRQILEVWRASQQAGPPTVVYQIHERLVSKGQTIWVKDNPSVALLHNLHIDLYLHDQADLETMRAYCPSSWIWISAEEALANLHSKEWQELGRRHAQEDNEHGR